MSTAEASDRTSIDELVEGGSALCALDDGRVLLVVAQVLTAPQAAGYGRSLTIMASQGTDQLERELAGLGS
ncbi:MAG: hypothetical protein U1E43_08370 [Rhodospirillales bacterium]